MLHRRLAKQQSCVGHPCPTTHARLPSVLSPESTDQPVNDGSAVTAVAGFAGSGVGTVVPGGGTVTAVVVVVSAGAAVMTNGTSS